MIEGEKLVIEKVREMVRVTEKVGGNEKETRLKGPSQDVGEQTACVFSSYF